MIRRVIAVPFGQMQKLAKDKHLVANNCFISISGSNPMVVFPANLENILTLYFDDIHSSDVQRYMGFAGILFESTQADKIIEFVLFHTRNPGNKVLYVNCAAGISRSGAVAAFVNELLGLDRQKFRADNPRISPNAHVIQVLKKRWNDFGSNLKPADLRATWLV